MVLGGECGEEVAGMGGVGAVDAFVGVGGGVGEGTGDHTGFLGGGCCWGGERGMVWVCGVGGLRL